MRFFRTVRHLSLRQIATRALRVVERGWWRVTRAEAPSPSPALAGRGVSSPSPHLWGEGGRRPDEGRAKDIAEGRFTFLNETRVRPSWHAQDVSRLWRFHLHSFDYARGLDAQTFRELAESWIDGNRRLGGDGWHPYTISLRIVNWCDAALALPLDPAFARTLCDSIDAQAQFLARHLERDVRGNHLLENARALIRAGAFFGDAKLTQRGLDVLRVEIPEQILADGGHFERNPGYHLRVLQVLEDIAAYADVPGLADAIARMRAFRDAIVPPDGRLPLLKDTADIAGLKPGLHPQPSRWLEASGFAVMRDDARGDFLIADFGRVCPDYLPAHAHADMFSFELTIGGKPVIVDSGVFEYAEGEWRRWFRSTAAHNTVEVDGRDQSEMWGSFRVGRRAHPRNVTWTENARYLAISGEHDGYAPLIHHRTIAWFPEERAWLVVDRVDGPPGHVARSLVHFHPDAAPPAIAPFGASAVAEEEGWYSEHFGEKRRNRVLVLMAETPARFGYAISAEGRPADAQALLRLLR